MPTAAQKAAAASAIGGKGPPKPPPKSAAPPDTYLDVQAARAKGPKGRQQRTPRAGAGSARKLPDAPASSTADTSTTRDELELRFDLAGGKMIGLHLDEDNVVLKLDDGGLAAKDGRVKRGRPRRRGRRHVPRRAAHQVLRPRRPAGRAARPPRRAAAAVGVGARRRRDARLSAARAAAAGADLHRRRRRGGHGLLVLRRRRRLAAADQGREARDSGRAPAAPRAAAHRLRAGHGGGA